jgi:drug/metabolite transporter (DMT)-like permease
MVENKQSSRLLVGFIISLTGAILFSTKAIFVKLAFISTGIDAISLLALRMLVALPFYIIAAWFTQRGSKQKPLTIKYWIWIIIMGILGYYLSSLFDFIGLQYVSAGLERLILFLYPTFAVLINTYLFKTKLSGTQLIALILTYLGIGIAYFSEIRTAHIGAKFYFGCLMIFLCAVTYSFYLVGTGKLVEKAGATRYTAYAMLAATVGIFVHYGITHNHISIQFSQKLLTYSLALGIIATVLPSFLLSSGMKKIGINNVSINTSIGPVSTIIQAHYFLGEKILPMQIVGTCIVIIGVVLIGWKNGK